MIQKKFLQIIGILFTIHLLDSTSSVYGMILEDQEDQEDQHHPVPFIAAHHVYENEDDRDAAMQNFNMVNCQHEVRPLEIIYRFILEDNMGNPPVRELRALSCQQCWEDRMDAGVRQLVRDNPPDDH